jgi:hypothetical protein
MGHRSGGTEAPRALDEHAGGGDNGLEINPFDRGVRPFA